MKAPQRDIAFRIYSGRSMGGTFLPGDRLHLESVPFRDIRIGDIVAFRTNGEKTSGRTDCVHRIIKRTPCGFIARGDCNRLPDKTIITSKNLIGRVFCVEREGLEFHVVGGGRGHWQAKLCRLRLSSLNKVHQRIRRIGGTAYRMLKASRITSRLWHPPLERVAFQTKDGVILKYLHRGRTVAIFNDASGEKRVRKPFDLFLQKNAKPFLTTGKRIKKASK